MHLQRADPAPFFAGQITPNTNDSFGQLAISTKAEVLNGQRQPIAGLYAAGTIANAELFYLRYAVSGASLCETIASSPRSSGFDKDKLEQAFLATGIAPTVRAEVLTSQDFICLAAALLIRTGSKLTSPMLHTDFRNHVPRCRTWTRSIG